MNQPVRNEARKRVLLLVNPHAGNRIVTDESIRALDSDLGAHVDLIVPPSHSFAEQRQIAREQISQGVDAVIVRGGDGAVGSAFDLVAQTGTPLGILPAGTGNDFARAEGIPRGQTSDLLRDLLTNVVNASTHRSVDALRFRVLNSGQEKTRWAANSINIGFDARINQVANATQNVPGSLRYLYALLKVIPDFSAAPFTVTIDDVSARFDAALISIQNGPYIGGGIPLAINANTTDGLLDVSIVTSGSKTALVSLFPTLYLNMHKHIRPLRSAVAEQIRVEVPPGIPIYADGDEIVETSGSPCIVEVEVISHAVLLLNEANPRKKH